MAAITVRFDAAGLIRQADAMAFLYNRTPDALRRGLNHTGRKAFVAVRRAVSKQIRAPQSAIQKYGKLQERRAHHYSLAYSIVSKGGPIPLKYFRPSQTARGVSAAPWGNRKVYKSSFMAGAMGGHVFWRKGKARFPIERIAGPNVPKEMVKDQSAAAFRAVSAELPARIAHEIRVITNGVVS